jgi:uncharacterized protein YxjI
MSNYPPPPPGGYAAPPPPGGYAQPPPGYGAPPPGYGVPPPGYAYSPQQQPAYGAPPPQPPAYGAPPHQQPAYGAPPPPQPYGGYGAPPPQQHQPPHGYPQHAPPPHQQQWGAPQPGYAAHQQQYAAPPGYGAPGHGQQHMYGSNPQAMPVPALGEFGLPLTPGQHTSRYSVTFKVEELVSSATRDSFVVKEMTGAMRYKVDGSFTVNERKTMVDMHGRQLLKIKEARLALRERITISDAHGSPVLTIQQASGAQLGAKTARAYVGGHVSGVPVFTINGNRNATHFRVTSQNGMELAVISRKAGSLKTRLTGQDSYETTVMPSVDQALMCMVTVACDEMWSD